MDFANRICEQFILVSPKLLGKMLGAKSGFSFLGSKGFVPFFISGLT